jgi:hypothetical protein
VSELLTLYRGDSTKIKEFEFNKTEAHSLVGQGIYLTTSLSVASSYRVKGHSTRDLSNFTMTVSAPTRSEAYDLFFEDYFLEYLRFWGLRSSHPEGSKLRRNLHELLKSNFRLALQEGQVTSKYSAVDFDFKKRRLEDSTRITVTWKKTGAPPVGYLTRFVFDRRSFEAGVIRIDGAIRDPLFWEILWEKGLKFGTPYDTKAEYIQYNSNAGHWYRRDLHPHLQGRSSVTSSLLQSLRRALQPYGYLGFEYQGGRYLGGLGAHRAFCIWDESYVNTHRVERSR